MNLLPKIIYEDSDILVLDKPAGLLVHSSENSQSLTLADWIVGQFPEILEVGEVALNKKGEEIARPGIVHRLDRDTSGVMVVAKNQESFLFLKEQFKNREVQKKYQAIVHGVFKDAEGLKVVDLPIGRSKSDPRLRVASKKASSKLREAITEYQILETLGDFSYVEASPKTGRTHQIRAHFKALQHPVVCDFLYAKGKTCPANFGLGRHALHAYSLKIKLPKGELREFIAPLPSDMATALEKLRQAC